MQGGTMAAAQETASREGCLWGAHQECQGAGASGLECVLRTLGSLWRRGSIPPKGGTMVEVVLWT